VSQQSAMQLKMVLPPAPWTRGFEDGRVGIPGVSWECNFGVENAPERFVASEAYDVGENGVRRLAISHLGGSPAVALPVYFGRELMQRNLLVRRDSNLHHPSDLAGKRVGSHLGPGSGTGGAVLMMLEQAYGLPLHDVEWHLGDPTSLPVNRMGLDLRPAPLDEEPTFAMLSRGDVDALIITGGPRYFSLLGCDKIDEALARHPDLRPLIEDPGVMADAYRRTRLYPITDVVVVRPDLPQIDPALPPRLVDAFARANALASEYRGADEEAMARREIELLGEDPHQCGLGENEIHNLATWIDFLYRLGAIDRAFDPAELFVPSTRP